GCRRPCFLLCGRSGRRPAPFAAALRRLHALRAAAVRDRRGNRLEPSKGRKRWSSGAPANNTSHSRLSEPSSSPSILGVGSPILLELCTLKKIVAEKSPPESKSALLP